MTSDTQTDGSVKNIDLADLNFNQRRYLKAKRCLITPDGEEIRLRAKTHQVFELLASKSNEVVAREDLVTSVWSDVIVSDDTLSQSIKEIRKALGDSDRKILETIPRQGYLLKAVKTAPSSEVISSSSRPEKKHSTLYVSLAAAIALLLFGGVYAYNAANTKISDLDVLTQPGIVEATDKAGVQTDRKNLTVLVDAARSNITEPEDRLAKAVVTALSHYSNIRPVQTDNPKVDYKLELSLLADDASSINMQLHHPVSDQLVLAETLNVKESTDTQALAVRIAAMIGSPAGGAIGNHLMQTSRHKPVEELNRAECLAHGYGCTSCSGEFDSVTPRAVQCLANILKDDPEDPDAWALQSTVYSRQYLWGSALQEPTRSDKTKRSHLKAKAVEAATRSEALADGSNSSVYWGMAQAYLASCNADKMKMAVERGLDINPGDPNMLAGLGNFLAYTGKWDDGKALIEQAYLQESRFFKKWWYMAPAKWHYRRGEYQQAYDLFIKSFNERNWLSHLQLAYTLPHLGRIEEAKQALQGFMRVAPSMTREHVYEFYRSYCFDNEFLEQIKIAFDMIDMPSRGSGDDFQNIQPVRATVEQIGDRSVEYVDVGNGTPVVFVHGSISDYRTWSYMLLPVSEKYRYLSYTLRLFGTLDWPDGKHQFNEQMDVEDLIDFIEHKELGSVYLVGWSRSGSIVSAVATERPDLVKGIIIYEPILNELLDPEFNPNPPLNADSPDFSKVGEYVDKKDLDAAVKTFFEKALERPAGGFQMEPTMLQRVVGCK